MREAIYHDGLCSPEDLCEHCRVQATDRVYPCVSCEEVLTVTATGYYCEQCHIDYERDTYVEDLPEKEEEETEVSE